MRTTVMLFIALAFAACVREPDQNILYLLKGKVTTVTEFRQAYQDWLTATGRADDPALRRLFLEKQITDEILYQKGKLEGIEYLPDVKEKIEEHTRRLIIDKSRALIERDLYPFDDETIKRYYAEHREEFVRDKLHRLYAVRTRKKERAYAAYRDLTENGVSIRILSARYSDDRRLADMNGDWGLFSEEVMDPAWKKAVLSGRIGDIVGPVRDGENYWTLIELTGLAYRRELPLERVYPLIVRKLREQAGDDRQTRYREQLLREYGVRINQNNLNWE